MSAQAQILDEFDSPPGEGISATARQFVTFSCAGQNFGINIMAMREIRNWSPVTPLPAQRRDVLGVIDIRGRVVPVHDLALRIGCLTERRTDHDGKIILVLNVAGHDMGLLVDSVSDIIEISTDDMMPVPQIEGSAARFLAGIARHGDTLVAILDEEIVRTNAVEIAGPEAIHSEEPMNSEGESEFVFVDDLDV